MTKLVLFSLLLLMECTSTTKPELIFLQKNAYEFPVWEDMLLQDRIKFSDVVLAFHAYASTHNLDEETMRHFEKLEKRMLPNLDSYGYYTSKLGQYKNLVAYRNATPNPQKAKKNFTNTANFLKFDVPNATNFGQWKNVGPFGNPEVRWSATGNGAIQHVEMHPTNPAIMYVSTRNGGLWRTVNYGKNWTPLTDYFATNNTSCLEISPANPAVFYLGAAEDQQIWHSKDSGKTWNNRSTGLLGSIYDIQSDPVDATRAIAATTQGIYLTTNSGLNWVQKVEGKFTDIEVTDTWDLIIVSSDGPKVTPVLHFTKDKGDTFIQQNIITHLMQVDRFYLGLHKPITGATKVFAYGIVNTNKPTRFIGLWSSDYTANPADETSYFNFTEVKHPSYTYPNGRTPLRYSATDTNGFIEETMEFYGSVTLYSTATWIGDFYVSPNNPKRMLTFREKFWGSEDGGIIWEPKPSYGENNWADNRYATTNTAKDSVFWCNDGGIWAIKESDLFPTAAEITAAGLAKNVYINSKVVSKNGDICVSEGRQMDVSQLHKGVFMTGGQDIGQIFTRNGRDTHVASADVYRGRIKPTNDSLFITGTLRVKLTGETTEFSVYNNIEPDHFNANRLYGFTEKDIRLVRSPAGKDGWLVNGFKGENIANAGGHTWTPTHSNWEIVPITSTGITALKAGTFEQSRANGEVAFLGDEVGNRLFITENLSAATPTWKQLTNAPQARRYRIATHQYNENIIVIATESGVYISKDKGQIWLKRANFPEETPLSILLDKNTSEGIYILTALTVYYIDESLKQWVEFNRGLPLQNNVDMRIAYYPNNDNRLYVAKYGRGVWASSLQSVISNIANKPVADFSFYGKGKNEIFLGEKVSLLDQSLHATSIKWTLENGTDKIVIANKKNPEVTLKTKGYYKVTLEATNVNGTSTKAKEYYILVRPVVTTPTCTLTSTGTIEWFQGTKIVRINTDSYTVPSRQNYIKSNKVFKILEGQQATFYTEDTFSPGFNFYTKAWIDFNNDGDFDDPNEEIATSNGQLENFTATFTPPSTAILEQHLTMRVSAINTSTAPTSCQNSEERQNVDLLIYIAPNTTFTSSHTVTSENSATLTNTFSGITNIKQTGFIYAKVGGVLTLNNASIAINTTALPANKTYTLPISNLEYNVTYFYRPFVINTDEIYYGNQQSFTLVAYKIPTAISLIAQNLGNNKWALKGLVFPENQLLDQLAIEYGTNDFSNTVTLNPASYTTTKGYTITSEITTILGNSYQFRVKFVSKGKTYYSSINTFNTEKTAFCIPTVKNNVWFKRIKNVTFDAKSNNSTASSGYENFSSIVYEVKPGNSYNISVTDTYSPEFNLNYVVYIDYNNDGDFSDYNEIATQGIPNADTFTSSITIPTENIVVNTNLRMRVIGYDGGLDYCAISAGQIEDYSIKIILPSLSNDVSFDALFSVSLYPNPAVSEVYVQIKNVAFSENYTAEIFDINGKKLYQKQFLSSVSDFKIDVRSFSTGIYLLRLSNKKGSRSLKFIKSE